MNLTSRNIALIVIQCFMVIVTVTVVGNAAITHAEFKATANKPVETQTQSVSNKSEENISKPTEVQTTVPSTAGKGYKYAYVGINPTIVKPGINLSEVYYNKDRILPDDYAPVLSKIFTNGTVELDYRVVPYYRAMYDAAKSDDIILTPISGYISIADHTERFEEYIGELTEGGRSKKSATLIAMKEVMLPGANEHNTGLAIDICSRAESFEDTDEFEWLDAHAHEYGFILRYPKGKEEITGVDYKPWLFRYVGAEAARQIKQQEITLEEFNSKSK